MIVTILFRNLKTLYFFT